MAAVTFNYCSWVARYPEFTGVDEDVAGLYFAEAGLYCANEPSNPAFAFGVLPALLNMLTAHIAWLNSPRGRANEPKSDGGQIASALVGRISTATEGSVTVQTDNQYEPGTPQWFQSTKYGAAFWAATTQFRTMRYQAHPTRVINGVFPFRASAGR